MTTIEFWLISGMALATFLCRYPLMALGNRLTLSNFMRRVLDYVGPAVLAAVIAPEIFTTAESAQIVPYLNARLFAGLLAGYIAWKTRSVWITISAGLLALLLLRALFNLGAPH